MDVVGPTAVTRYARADPTLFLVSLLVLVLIAVCTTVALPWPKNVTTGKKLEEVLLHSGALVSIPEQ